MAKMTKHFCYPVARVVLEVKECSATQVISLWSPRATEAFLRKLRGNILSDDLAIALFPELNKKAVNK